MPVFVLPQSVEARKENLYREAKIYTPLPYSERNLEVEAAGRLAVC